MEKFLTFGQQDVFEGFKHNNKRKLCCVWVFKSGIIKHSMKRLKIDKICRFLEMITITYVMVNVAQWEFRVLPRWDLDEVY